jgi:subtilisin family serine protease
MFVGAMPPAVNGTNFPCDIDGVIAVASTEFPVLRKDALLAPGLDLLTLTPEGHYDFASGSSLAAANVSGAIALLLARERTLRSTDARQLLENTANPISAAQASTGINACAALSSLLHEAPCAPL